MVIYGGYIMYKGTYGTGFQVDKNKRYAQSTIMALYKKVVSSAVNSSKFNSNFCPCDALMKAFEDTTKTRISAVMEPAREGNFGYMPCYVVHNETGKQELVYVEADKKMIDDMHAAWTRKIESRNISQVPTLIHVNKASIDNKLLH
jgi:hypothetical protein